MTDVKMTDRVIEVESLRMVLSMCELGVSYTQADLINRVVKKLQAKPNLTIKDALKILTQWKSKWEEYSKNQNTCCKNATESKKRSKK